VGLDEKSSKSHELLLEIRHHKVRFSYNAKEKFALILKDKKMK